MMNARLLEAACHFDEELVLRQLRYTGMLATVKIRQAGYNMRLTFEVGLLPPLLTTLSLFSSSTGVHPNLSSASA
jgi:myosin-9